MADITVNTQLQDVQVSNEKFAKLETAPEILNETVETQAQSPSPIKHESESEASSPVQEKVENDVAYNAREVTQNLGDLHHKVDQILHKHVSTTHHLSDIIHQVSSLHASAVGAHELARSSYIPHHTSPYVKYDKHKLDEIVSRILQIRYNPHRIYEKSAYLNYLDNYAHTTYDRNQYHQYSETRYAPLRVYERPTQTFYTHTPYEPVAKRTASPLKSSSPMKSALKTPTKVQKEIKAAPKKTHEVGVFENDTDSLVLDHIKAVHEEVEMNHQQYNNFYVGSINEDVDEVPRTKRIGKRQEIAESRRSVNNSELVQKSVYDQRNNKNINEQAKKALKDGGVAGDDFDFAKAQNNKRV